MNFLKNTKKMLSIIIGAGMLIMASTAVAIPITGEISFVGSAQYSGGTTAATATGIHFVSGLTLGVFTGSYAGVPNFTPVTFTDFTFSPTMSPSPVAPLWTFVSGGSTYHFNMTSVVASVGGVGSSSLTLNGEGILGITGFDNTPGIWTMTTQNGSTPTSTLTFSDTSSASPVSVPEPGMFLLFGTSLVGLSLFDRRKNSLV